jgi:polar amino acid transport system substrate-binding protein
LAGSSLAQTVPELTFLGAPSPGLIQRSEGTLEGPAIDLVMRLVQEAGATGKVVEAPLARALLDAKTRAMTCAIGPARTQPLERDFHWFGPLARTRMVVFGRPSTDLRLTVPSDLRGKRLVVTRGSLPDEWVTALNLSSTRVADHAASYRMLLRGHADFWVANELLGNRLVQELGGERLPVVLVAQTLENYVACHRGLPEGLVTRLTKAVGTLKSQGALAQFGID